MSPDAKEVLDYLVALAGAGSLGGVALAFFGWMKARAEKAHIISPTTGAGALAPIGGMVIGQQDLRDLIDAMRGISASHDRCTLMRETEMEASRRAAKERREHEDEIQRERHEKHWQTIDGLRTLNDRLRDAKLSI